MRSRLYGAAVVLQFTRSHSMQASVSMTGNPRIGARPRNFSRPSGELEPAFETLLANVTRLCQAKFGILHVREGDSFRMAAVHGAPPAYIAYRRHQPLIGQREFPHLPLARLARTKSVQHVADLTRERAYIERDPLMVALVRAKPPVHPNAKGERCDRRNCHLLPGTAAAGPGADRAGQKLREPGRHCYRECPPP